MHRFPPVSPFHERLLSDPDFSTLTFSLFEAALNPVQDSLPPLLRPRPLPLFFPSLPQRYNARELGCRTRDVRVVVLFRSSVETPPPRHCPAPSFLLTVAG